MSPHTNKYLTALSQPGNLSPLTSTNLSPGTGQDIPDRLHGVGRHQPRLLDDHSLRLQRGTRSQQPPRQDCHLQCGVHFPRYSLPHHRVQHPALSLPPLHRPGISGKTIPSKCILTFQI